MVVRELAKIVRPTMSERLETPLAALEHPDPLVRSWAVVYGTFRYHFSKNNNRT